MQGLTATRTTVYARVASVATACELLAPLISSALMLKDPWIPVLLGFAVFLMGALTTLVILPETLLRHPTPEDVPDAHSEPEIRPLKFSVLTGRLWALVAEFRQSIYSILAINGIGFLLFGFFTITIGSIAGAFELQYTHKRFGWSYSFVSFQHLRLIPICAFYTPREPTNASTGGLHSSHTANYYALYTPSHHPNSW